MKKFKALFSFLCIFVLIFNVGILCFAEAGEYNDSIEMQESKLAYISFQVINDTGREFTDDIHITLSNEEYGLEYSFVLTASSRYGGGEVIEVMDEIYTIKTKISPNNEGIYKLTGKNGEALFKLVFINKTSPLEIQPLEIHVVPSSTKNGTDDVSVSGEKNNNQETLAKGIYADKINDFIKSTSFIADKEGNITENSSFLNLKARYSSEIWKETFIQTGYTVDIWNEMSDYKKVCWGILYGRPTMMFYSDVKEMYIKDYETYIGNLQALSVLTTNQEEWEIFYEAAKKTWDWHWDTYQSTGKIIDPFDESFFKNDVIEDGLPTDENGSSITDSGSLPESSVGGSSSDTPETTEGGFISLIKENIITLILLIVAGTAVAFIAYKRKKLNNTVDDIK